MKRPFKVYSPESYNGLAGEFVLENMARDFMLRTLKFEMKTARERYGKSGLQKVMVNENHFEIVFDGKVITTYKLITEQ